MKERLQKILSARGVCSRREAERLIRDGKVTVDGDVAFIGDSADPDTQTITVNGVPLPPVEGKVYIMLNKPRGVITSMHDEKGRPTVFDLVSDCKRRVYPVGRLDYDSDGLLIMTNDGELANMLMHPSAGIYKKYRVTVKENAVADWRLLSKPLNIDGYSVLAKEVALISSSPSKSVIDITIGEGRNRQIRKMCEQCGMSVLSLTRIKEGNLSLGDLPKGKWRYLTQEEVQMLTNLHHEQ